MGNGFSTKHTGFWPWRFSPVPPPPPSTLMPRPHPPPPGAPPPTPMATAPTLLNFPHASSSRRSPTLCDGLPPPPRYFSTAPPPGPSPASPPQAIVKLLSSIGTVVSVALSVLPYFYEVYTGTFERTVQLYGAPAKLAGLVSSIIWLMYAILTNKSDPSVGLLLTHAFLCMSTFTYLMGIYAYKRATREGYTLGAIFIGCLSIMSILVNFDVTPHEIVKGIFGFLGVISLGICHYIQIKDILASIPKRSQKIATAIDLVPNCIMNLMTFIVTLRVHPGHTFILFSSEFGFIINVVEILLLVIIAIVGYFFPRAENANADDEGQLQNDHMSVALHMNRDTRGMIPLEYEQGTPETEDSITGLTHEPQVLQLDASYLILQVRNVLEIHSVRPMVNPNAQARVILLVEAITRTMMQIERDLYIPILVQASGLAAAAPSPYPNMLRDIEIHYRMIRAQQEALPQ